MASQVRLREAPGLVFWVFRFVLRYVRLTPYNWMFAVFLLDVLPGAKKSKKSIKDIQVLF